MYQSVALSCITICRSMSTIGTLQSVTRVPNGLILVISVILRKPWALGTQPPRPQNHDFVVKNRSAGRQTPPKCSTIVYNNLREYEHHRGIAKCHTGPQRADFAVFSVVLVFLANKGPLFWAALWLLKIVITPPKNVGFQKFDMFWKVESALFKKNRTGNVGEAFLYAQFAISIFRDGISPWALYQLPGERDVHRADLYSTL